MASIPRRRKRCRFCNQLFLPDPRLKSRQVACSTPECQKARKKANQTAWLERRPGYFEGRYANTKGWLAENPGYLSRYRKEHPEKVQRDNESRKDRRKRAKKARADIQDSIWPQDATPKALRPLFERTLGADIQDSILRQLIMMSALSAQYLRADIQDSIAPPSPDR